MTDANFNPNVNNTLSPIISNPSTTYTVPGINSIDSLGTIVTSHKARKIIYGIYAIIAIAVGGAVAYFFGIGHTLPVEVIGAQAVIAYLAIPIGGLALANTPSKN